MEKILRAGDKITVHFIDHCRHKTPTEERVGMSGKVFEVKEINGKLGFDGNINRSPYTCKGELFTPFKIYSWTVIFKNVDNGELFRYSNIKKDLENITDLQDGYVDKIVWLD